MKKSILAIGIWLCVPAGCKGSIPDETAMQTRYPDTPVLLETPYPDTPVPTASQTPASLWPTWTPTQTSTREVHPTPWPTPTPGLPPSLTPPAPETCPLPTGKDVSFQYQNKMMDYEQDILVYLQVHGISVSTRANLQDKLGAVVIPGITPGFANSTSLQPIVLMDDLTGDGRPEMVILLSQSIPDKAYEDMGIFIFGCHAGAYQSLYTSESFDMGYSGVVAKDLNADGIRELVIQYQYETTWQYHDYSILEWDGSTFRDLFSADENAIASQLIDLGEPEFKDVDGNGTLEVLAPHTVQVHGAGYACSWGPTRSSHFIIMWVDGQFRLLREEFAAPEYRFQAAYDGDNYASHGLNDKAINSYQQAINNPDLKPASRGDLQRDGYFACENSVAPDKTEPDQIRAYASYRWMILETYLGNAPEAQQLLIEMENKYPQGNTGYSFTQIAGIFWQEYQATQKASLACQKVRNGIPLLGLDPFSVFENYGWGNEGPDNYTICPY